MTKFFDKKTKTLFITGGKTAVTDLSDNPLIQLPDPEEMPPTPQLHRQNASAGKYFQRHYISALGEEYHGNFDLKHPTNKDLEEVQDTIYCP
ncbi:MULTISPECIES: hypothetical protein [unclassified Legionella]|uniref:hypothetical protein n=1 Tax=Legionella sp. PC997 TaxID=2755562 RepID=UPI0015FAA93B|nr:hypothetical protein [Legionella sp. PC997]QMT60025.1 hypothetical protein HBNCFIEN_01394 [Legionella sp. PC997]